ncbi:DUF4224 domain-containing protein [Bordetella sp. 15P40C-2]|uniref:DUF4224 domain-containing protein n=1 Tax=Bordetella sp. 15P40C-2 TaxID=2572246 RepID=UPI00132061E3|nr:DUF4224 domain-containing protein [Bordetella sp. 15P40C-2]MVW72174.1 DUF4224 domain-containing protein [Bordetella sp. 15P40C-2]
MLTLTAEEIAEVTRKVRGRPQCEVLRQMGIPFVIRPDGTPVVLRAAMEAALGYATKETGTASPKLRLPQARGILSSQRR